MLILLEVFRVVILQQLLQMVIFRRSGLILSQALALVLVFAQQEEVEAY
jgi:hypothetical protein